nr:SusC/RagA family TonB-linked outer membrane protein [Prevotella sp.]
MSKTNIILLSLLAGCSMPALAQQDSIITGNPFVDQVIEVGANKNFTRRNSTAAVTVIQNKDVNKRSSKNIGNSIIGQGGNGLVSIQNAGTYYNANPTFYVRGLQSLSSSSPLILVDGIERDIDLIDPTEVESVEILKDAAATAIYGYKGINGAIAITTKRGKYNSKEIKVNYDHLINYQINRPKFINSQTYSSAMNEALSNEGSAAKYTDQEIAAFGSGAYSNLYPNVNWVDETFRHHGITNKVSAEFTGGTNKFRYYSMVNLLSDKGFIKNFTDDNGNNTQDKYVKGNLRINLDVDLTPSTTLKVNALGVLGEMSQPGNQTNLWGLVYSLPSAAFPVKNSETGLWGGSVTWAGTNNPVANTAGAAYYKIHERALYGDLTLNQDLGAFLKGLSATLRIGYDTYSTVYENHSKTYAYSYYTGTDWSTGSPVGTGITTGGQYGTQSQDANTNAYTRRLTFNSGLNYEHYFPHNHYWYSSLRWDYEYENTTGVNTTVYRQTASWLNHYEYLKRYIMELSLVAAGSSRLAPGTKWCVSPTLSGALVLSEFNGIKDLKWLDFWKLRASYGRLNADYLPGDNVWTYYTQSYSTDGVTYPFNSGYDSSFGRTTLGQMATSNPSHEKSDKFNLGMDASLFKGLNVEMDVYYQHRSDIWVSGDGAYGSIIGFTAPYVNKGEVNSWGYEASVDYSHKFGQVMFNIGSTFSLNKNNVSEQAEEPRAYSNLVTTNSPLNSIWGLKAIGLFQSEEEIANSPTQTYSTVYPGDIKYEDINNDGKIDDNDKVKIGHSTVAPEIYYTFHLGAEYKGIGIDAMFQGVGRYSAILNTTGYYWGLISNRTLSQYVYDNRWTPSNPNAEFPRLSSSSNANNYQTSSFWLRDRSFFKLRNLEVYYNFSKSLLSKTGFLNGAKVYVRGNDLFTLDHLDTVDAESYGATSPLNRSLVFGASLTF